jgi:glycosyltransferase involved in cell wall biosynthesis
VPAPVVCTAVALHELALARVLADGLRRVHPDWRLTVLILDGEPPEGEPFEAIGREALGSGYAPGLLEALTDGPRPLAAALRPALMAALAEAHGGPVVWLDATVRPLGSLVAVVAAGRDGIALVPLHDRFGPPTGLAARGPFESGVVAAGDAEALHWWSDLMLDSALRHGARFDPLAAELLGAVAAAIDARVVRERGTCVGWWTLASGGRVEGDPPLLDGAPLAALNLVGFDPARPHWLSDEDPAGTARVSEQPALARLLASHAGDLLAAGWRTPDADGWRYATLPDGPELDDDLRDLLAQARREGEVAGDPFTAAGRDALFDWVAGEAAVGAGVGRYLERVHRRRPDLQIAFPDLAGGDGAGLVAWEREHGVAEEPVLTALAERRAERKDVAARERVGEPRTAEDRRVVAAGGAAARAVVGSPGVRLVGYLGDGLGLGEAARSYARALAAAGIGIEAVPVPAPMEQLGVGGRPPRRRRVDWRSPDASAGGRPLAEIVCVNPPELLRLSRAGLAREQGVHRIGVWAWELDAIPERWAEAYALVDEVWVYSEYVARALRDAPVPVTVMPLAIDVDRLEQAAAAAPPAETFRFLFMFDLLSSLERKNPLGLIEAFRSAFEPGEGPRLLIKTSNGDNRPEQLERVRVAALGRPDVEVVDEFVDATARDALAASCGCYVSLHRAEGFGLTLAEAMAAGRPTIATGFSGNLDFTSPATTRLVDWSPALVEPGSAIYTAGARWAEPDLADAAAALRETWADRDAAWARGLAGSEQARRLLTPAAVGERIAARLAEIGVEPRRRGTFRRLRSAVARRRGRP